MIYYITRRNFNGLLPLFYEILVICVFQLLFTRLWRHELWISRYLSHQAIFSTWKSQDKNLSISRTKRAFKLGQKAFFIIFKGLSLKQIKSNFLVGEGPTLKILYFSSCKFIGNKGLLSSSRYNFLAIEAKIIL